MNDLRVVERLRLPGCVCLLLLPIACSSLRSEPPGSDRADTPCPSQIQDEIKVRASASRSPDPAAPGNIAHMLVGRQALISVSPGAAATGLHLLSSVLTVTSTGGTFAGVLSASDSNARAIDVIPGRLRIAPFVTGATLHPQSVSLDLLVAPGGAAADEMVVTQDALWDAQRRPLPAQQVTISLQPIQHFTMYDEVRATLSLTIVLAPSRSVRQRWSCSAEGQFTLVDRAAATPQLWDLRRSVAAGRSELWLALFDDRWGAFRAAFASPADAAGFADWLRQTHEHRVGAYRLGMFRPEYSRERLRTVPTPHSITDTFRDVSADDLDSLVVGRLGEP